MHKRTFVLRANANGVFDQLPLRCSTLRLPAISGLRRFRKYLNRLTAFSEVCFGSGKWIIVPSTYFSNFPQEGGHETGTASLPVSRLPVSNFLGRDGSLHSIFLFWLGCFFGKLSSNPVSDRLNFCHGKKVCCELCEIVLAQAPAKTVPQTARAGSQSCLRQNGETEKFSRLGL